MAKTAPEGGGGNYGPNSGGYDQLGYGTLTFSRDPIAGGAAPSGLTGHASEGKASLSWWGGASATSYNVKRAVAGTTTFITLATGITDPRTYLDQPPAPGTYDYVITAATPSGESAPSNVARVVTATELATQLTFDEDAGIVAVDGTHHGHDGALVGGATWAPGHSQSGVSLDGKSSYVTLPEGVVADLQDFTISAWIYCSTNTKWTRLFDFGDGIGHYMMLTPFDGSGRPRFVITSNLGAGEQKVESSVPLSVGAWTHVAITLAGNVATLYINGVVAGTNGAVQLAPFRLGRTNQNWLGRSQYATDPFFSGRIDDLRIYTGALKDQQIAALAAQ